MSKMRSQFPKITDYRKHLDEAWRGHTAKKPKNAPTVVSTFAGCGGSSLGYSMAGYRELLAVEMNDNAVECLRANFPDIAIHHGDIATLTDKEALKLTGVKKGELDLFDGSPPCQGFSTAGKRIFDDNRNQLFREYVRLLRAFEPKVFVMENVSGMVKGKMSLLFVEILRELKSAGYKVTARLLDAQWFGVPQSRKRLIFIGVRDDIGIDPSHPTAQSQPVDLRTAIGDLGNEQDPSIGHVWTDESPNGRNTKTYPLAKKTRQGQKIAGQQRRYQWHKPAGTLTTGGFEGMPPYLRSLGCHPIYTRTFSQLEYRRIGSFPENYKFAGDWHLAFTRIGNCVPPLLTRAISLHIKTEILSKAGEK